MFEACERRQKELKEIFDKLDGREAKYNKIIELGRELKPMQDELKRGENLVRGCQSRMYLATQVVDDKVFFETSSDALISAGLAALLLFIYDGQDVSAVVGCKPMVLQEIGLTGLLSPSRSNGLASLYRRMQMDTINQGEKRCRH